MSEEFYYTEANGTPTGRKVMRAQFVKVPKPEGDEQVETRINGSDKKVKMPKNWKPAYTRLCGTEKLVQDCKTGKEVKEFFQSLPEGAKIG